MKIAILADVHDNAHNLILALRLAEEHGSEKMIFLGDFMNGGIAKILAASQIPTYAILGNNDGSLVQMANTAHKKGSNLTLNAHEHALLDLDGKRVFLTHYPEIARPISKSGEFDAVFYGHDHHKHQERVGKCLLLNPGEISAHKTGEASMAFWDTKTDVAEIVPIKGSITLKTPLVDEHMAALPEQFRPRRD